MPIDAHVREAILAQPEQRWTPAVDPDGHCFQVFLTDQPNGDLAGLRLQHNWPWTVQLAQAFTRLRALPLRC
jgi:hypothetical protein